MKLRVVSFRLGQCLVFWYACAGLALLGVTLAPCAAGQLEVSDVQAKVNYIFRDLNGHNPGCVVGVIQKGSIAYSHAYGLANLELSVPLTVDSVFSLESMSKQFTGMSIALLVTERKLALTDDIHKYLPELPDYQHLITIADLLHHTSGLKDYSQLLTFSGLHGMDLSTPEMALDLIRRQHDLNFNPGSKFSYSDTNYFLLALVVERISGESLADFAKHQIFEPLGMRQTQFRRDATSVIPLSATGYRKRSDGWHTGNSGSQVIGASGVFSTLADLAKWDQNFHDKKVGGEATIKLMLEQSRLSDGSPNDYSMGLELKRYRGLAVVEHAGDGMGFQTDMMRFPEEGYSVAVLCNVRDQVSPSQLAERVADIYLADRLQPHNRPHPSSAYSVSEYLKFAGVYWDGSTDLLREISVKDGKLTQRLLPDDEPRELRHLSGRRFIAGNDVIYEFAETGPAFLRIPSGSSASQYRRLPDADLRPQDPAQFTGAFYSSDIDTRWQFTAADDHLVLHRKGFPDEQLDFEFRDGYLGDLGLFHFIRNESGDIVRLDAMNYRLGTISLVKEIH